MITIDQLLESVDLDFEPRFVTKDEKNNVCVGDVKPVLLKYWWGYGSDNSRIFGRVELAEFEGKDWTECIYEVPRKTIGKIEKLKYATVSKCGDVLSLTSTVNGFNVVIDKLNTVIDAVNELKGAKND